jgi:hypothetical protein
MPLGDGATPESNESFYVPIKDANNFLEVRVKQRGVLGSSKLLGSFKVFTSDLLLNGSTEVRHWFKAKKVDGLQEGEVKIWAIFCDI